MISPANCPGAKTCNIVVDVLDSFSSALIHYTVSGEFFMANSKALNLFPEIGKEESPFSTFRQLIDFIYDHSLDAQDQEELFGEDDSESGKRTIFQDMVELTGRIFLVQASLRENSAIVVVLTDVTLIKKKADAIYHLSAQNRQLVEAVEASPNGVFIAEQGGAVTFTNAALCRMMGVSAADLIGLPMEEMLRKNFPNGGIDVLKSLKKGDMGIVFVEKRDDRGIPFGTNCKFLCFRTIWSSVFCSTRRARKCKNRKCFNPKNWKRSGNWRVASRTISTIFSRLSKVIPAFSKAESRKARMFPNLSRKFAARSSAAAV